MTDINVSAARISEPVRVFVDGELIAEVVGGSHLTRTDLIKEVQEARVLEKVPAILCRLIKELTSVKKEEERIERARGLIDGLMGARVPHPMPGVQTIRPDYSLSYAQGYDLGGFLASVARRDDERTRDSCQSETSVKTPLDSECV